ncbi:MAG: hypothetical protein AMJ78_00020 [Omnitrophica WOR_2 bacterium SM23_29]|nr:MAG: hypothetical protein AMJ78_00020 [Omnitrophica WOR_2 bacterium SM23_29]
MKLYLIQHGLSLPEDVDPKKGLSEKGKLETVKMVLFLKMRKIKADIIWHSKKLRSIQTAQILAEHIPDAKTQERDNLNPQDPVEKFPQEIQALNKDLMIAGHLPFLQKLASRLLSGQEAHEFIFFKNSGVVCLENKETWKIMWVLIPDLL